MRACCVSQDQLKPAFTVASLPGTASSPTAPSSSTSMQVTSGPSFPITNYLAPPSSNARANGSILKSTSATAGVMQLPGGFTFMSGTLEACTGNIWKDTHPIIYMH